MQPTLKIIKGDATRPQAVGTKIIAHVCNDIGGWGKGFVLAISRRWPEPEREYRRWYRERASNDFQLGAVQLVGPDTWVANMVAQRGVRRGSAGPPIRYEAVEQCLDMERHLDLELAPAGLPGGPPLGVRRHGQAEASDFR